jgi:HAE1 family hydrophobic/amphiphilic exporter-1
MGLANDLYAQIGIIMLIGLLGKNAVLIVEFAVQKQRQGATVLEAAIEGSKARFRPVFMTSFTFIAGLIPLVFAPEAGQLVTEQLEALPWEVCLLAPFSEFLSSPVCITFLLKCQKEKILLKRKLANLFQKK